MTRVITNDESINDAGIRADELQVINPKSGADEIVLYDECGDTLWDRVLKQEESKLHFPQATNS